MAVGQYFNYRRALRSQEPARILYLAVPSQTYEEFFRLRFIQEGVVEYQLYVPVQGRYELGGFQPSLKPQIDKNRTYLGLVELFQELKPSFSRDPLNAYNFT